MDSPHSLDMEEEVRMSPKLSSRRKRSRPVKFNQDFVMTDDLPHTSAYLSPEKHSYDGPRTFMGEEPREFLQTNDLSPASSPRKIQRQVTSIRDVSLMKGNTSRKIKVEDNGSQHLADLKGSPDLQQTTFSSLLHTFASQVNNRVETNERQSPYYDPSTAPKTIWPVTNSSPPTLPSTPRDSSRQSQHKSDSPARNPGQDMSFSGMLQNFVSCVNDSPTNVKDTSAQQPSLKSLLTLKQKSFNHRNSTNGSPFTGSTPPSVGNDQQSFAGLLHSFASVVDKGKQELLQEKRQKLRSDLQQRSSPSGQEQTQKGSKSLLDVLHDTISRRVLETVPSSQQDEFMPQTSYSQSPHNTQLDKVMQFNMDIPAQANAQSWVERGSKVDDFLSRKSFQARADRYEPEDELHPNSHQWSHIKNVLPPLDDAEEDAGISQRQQSHADGMHYHTQTIKMEPQDEDPSVGSHYDPVAPEDQGQYLLIGSACLDEDEEAKSSNHQVRVKEEPGTSPPGGIESEMSGRDVNNTLRERLLMRIGSRQSLHQSPTLSSSPTMSPETQLNHHDSDQISSTQIQGDPSGSKQPPPNQPGLVSHLLSTGTSSHWRNKENGSFADLLHNITSSMLEKDTTGDKANESQPTQISIKQEPDMSDEEPQIESVQEFDSAKDDLGSVSLTSLLQKDRSSNLKAPKDRKKAPLCVTRLHGNTSQSADCGDFKFSDRKSTRAQKKRAVSYAEPPSLSTSPSLSSEEIDQTMTPDASSRTTSTLVECSQTTRAKHPGLFKHRLKRGLGSRYGLKIKQGWPNKRKEDLHQKRVGVRSFHVGHKPSSARRTDIDGQRTTSPAPKRTMKPDTMSFTDILQQLAQKCQAGSQDPVLQVAYEQNMKPENSSAGSTHDQAEHAHPDREHVDFNSDVLSNVPGSPNLKDLLLKQSSIGQNHPEDTSPSRTPSTSSSRDVSFSDIMQNMASTVTKKRGSPNATEDLTSLDPPAPWVKSMSGNWLRFVLISQDENPRITTSVSVNLWNTIHEVKINCHHLEVPANHWIFRRFGKRIHTKAALQGVLQAISNGCSVCEGTTRGDLVHMYRNKLASTTRWQAAALLEDSFGTATIRSSQCELLVSGLRRSREKRCSKCSKYVDRKLKAVMYHMKKKLGLN